MRTTSILSTAALLCIALPACSLLVDFEDDGRFDAKSNAGAGGRTGSAGAAALNQPYGGSTVGAASNNGGGAAVGLGGAVGTSSTSVVDTSAQGGAGATSTAQNGLGGTSSEGGSPATVSTVTTSAGTGAILPVQYGGTNGGGAAGAAGTAVSTVPTCSAGTKLCGSGCVDVSTDKAHCGNCDNACEGYQFCEESRCLPTYVSTRLLAATDPTMIGAAVAKDKSKGDLILEFSTGTTAVTLSPPGAERISTVEPYRTALARYTPEGTLTWGRDLANVVEGYKYANYPFLLASTGDLILPYGRDIPGTGPNPGYTVDEVARIGGYTPTLVWTSRLLTHGSILVERPKMNDYLSMGAEPDRLGVHSSVSRIQDNGSSATATKLGGWYGFGAATDPVDSTLWTWNGYSGTNELNPWSAQTWLVLSRNLVLIGSRDDGSSIGPWSTEGDAGLSTFSAVIESGGDLIGVAKTNGYVTFNGGQELSSAASVVLARIRPSTGQVVWRRELPNPARSLAIAPGNRILVLDILAWDTTAQVSCKISIYSASDGQQLSSLSAGACNLANAPLMVSGVSELFLVGQVGAAIDFDPGPAADHQGTTPGVYISRFSF